MGFIVKKTKYKFVFLRKEYSTMNIVRVMVKKQPERIIRFDKKSYDVNLEFPSYNVKNFKVYFINIDSGSQMRYEFIKNRLISDNDYLQMDFPKPVLTPKELDDYLQNKLIRELASGVMDDSKTKMKMIFLGGIMGGLLVAMIMMTIYNEKINALYETLSNQNSFVPFGG